MINSFSCWLIWMLSAFISLEKQLQEKNCEAIDAINFAKRRQKPSKKSSCSIDLQKDKLLAEVTDTWSS